MNRHNCEDDPEKKTPDDRSSSGHADHGGMSLSMHDGVEVWCDCCSCEAEPYWLEAFAQLESESGIKESKGSDSIDSL